MKRHLTKILVVLICIGLISTYFLSSYKSYKRSVNNSNSSTSLNEVPFTIEGILTIADKNGNVKKEIEIEIAETSYETQTGLMYRNGMEENRGMLFIFKEESQHYFYMRNTRFPLDIIYINKNMEIVSAAKEAVPFDETSLPSKYPVQYVLEVNGGMMEKWGVKEGDKISFKKL